MAGDVHSHQESLARRVGQPALKVRLGRECNGVQGEVEPAPALAKRRGQGVKLRVVLHVAGQEDGGLELLCERLDVGAGLVVEIGDRQLGPQCPEGPGTAVGDRMVVGDPHNQSLAALERAV